MMDWLVLNKESIAGFVVGAGAILGTVWAWLLKAKTEKTKASADVAIAASQKEVYEQMRERMTMQEQRQERHEQEIDELRKDIRLRDTRIHNLELYVADLQHILHLNGIDIPVMRGTVVPPTI